MFIPSTESTNQYRIRSLKLYKLNTILDKSCLTQSFFNYFSAILHNHGSLVDKFQQIITFWHEITEGGQNLTIKTKKIKPFPNQFHIQAKNLK